MNWSRMTEVRPSAIHSTAIISLSTTIGSRVEIGPYAIIGEDVSIGDGTRVGPHVVIEGPTEIGRENLILGQSSIGTIPQDLKYKGERSWLRIGDRNRIREFVTINRGTLGGINETVIGNDNLLMAGVHIAHDCVLGDGTVFSNCASLAGHVEVGDHAILGGFAGVQQFCRVGPHAFLGAYSVLTRDALPFIKTVGSRNQARIYGINQVGLERKDFSKEEIEQLKRAYRVLFRKGLLVEEAVEQLARQSENWESVRTLIDFIQTSESGCVRATSDRSDES